MTTQPQDRRFQRNMGVLVIFVLVLALVAAGIAGYAIGNLDTPTTQPPAATTTIAPTTTTEVPTATSQPPAITYPFPYELPEVVVSTPTAEKATG